MRSLFLYFLFSFSLAILLVSCNDDEEETPTAVSGPDSLGLAYSTTDKSATALFNDFKTAVNGNANLTVIAEVDHSANAASVNESLPFTRTLIFGNPNLGTPLMQANIVAGLDLPQKFITYEDSMGTVFGAYNSTEYLAKRHGVGSVSTIPMITGALDNLTNTASGMSITINSSDDVSLNEGIVQRTSNNDFTTTVEKIKTAINNNSALRLVAEHNHGLNAEKVNMELDSSKVLIFGNPNLGTPLMRADPAVSIDLPQKMLIYDDGTGQIMIAYNNPTFLTDRHKFLSSNLTLMIAEALANLAAAGGD